MIASLMPQITQLDRLPLQRTAIIAYTQDATQPVRVERHVPASIASRRAELIAALAPILTRCPTCLQSRSA